MITEGNYYGGNSARRAEACSRQARGGFETLRGFPRGVPGEGPDCHSPKEIVGFGPIPARIRGFKTFMSALSTARYLLNVKNMFFLNWESLVPEVPHILGGLGVVVGGLLVDVGAWWGGPLSAPLRPQ